MFFMNRILYAFCFRSRLLFLFTMPVFLLLNACSSNVKTNRNTDPSAQAVVETYDVKGPFRLDSLLFDSVFSKAQGLQQYKIPVRDFYDNREWAFAWYGRSGLREHAGFLLQFLQRVQLEGVNDSFPELSLMEERMNIQARSDSLSPPDPVLDVLLTAAFFWYTDVAWSGLPIEKSNALGWFLPRHHINKTEWLDSALIHSPDGSLLSKAVFRQYYWLRKELVRLDSLSKSGGWPKVELLDKSLHFGESDSLLPILSQSLFLHGDLPYTDTASVVVDSFLVAGIKRFQARHGLKPDGVAGPSFFRQLNVTVESRMDQILLNMERSRWMPSDYPPDYLIVNIPDFSLYAYTNGKQQWTIPVVVGKELHETATFKGVLKHIVFNPYWVIPPGILYKEIIPGVRSNPSYLKKHNMEVVDRMQKVIPAAKIDWTEFLTSGFPYTIRQKPGPNNSLGKVKFLFPNNFSIYLHDTPSRSLFQEEKRAFSHGCIRVGDPEKLANFILNKENWSPQEVRSALKSSKEQWVNLTTEIPVYIVYFTAWVENDGSLQFRDDIYKRDEKLKNELLESGADF